MLFILCWNDETKEVYESYGERAARIHQLEEQGYERVTDFILWTE